jgi:hypothetical protein
LLPPILWISGRLKFRNVLREVMHIGVERLVIGIQELVIIFLVVLLLFDQLKRPNAPRDTRQARFPSDDTDLIEARKQKTEWQTPEEDSRTEV